MVNKTAKSIKDVNIKISDIINENPYIILMLEHFGIYMGVQEKTVQQICHEKDINTELFITIANLFNGVNISLISEYSNKDIGNIIKYLQNCHLYYIEEKYPQISNYIKKIDKNSETIMIEKFFEKYFKEVNEHLEYENKVVFPYILNLNEILSQQNTQNIIINYSVIEYKEHHNDIEEKLNDLKNILIKYIPVQNHQQIRRKLLLSLFELEYDLNIHSRIEDAILIPLVEKMEKLAKQKQ